MGQASCDIQQISDRRTDHIPENYATLASEFPDIPHIMLGRGILKDPFLVHKLRGNPNHAPDKDTIKAFLNELFARYTEIMSGEMPILYKMNDRNF